MRKLALAIFLFVTAFPACASTYYLAPATGGGRDSNTGTSVSTPWLTPNHAVNCGDVILAAANPSYSSSNFTFGSWGPVSCSGHGVAWLKCETFDACKITSSGGSPGIILDTSHWGIQGWEVSVTASSYAGCFIASANYSTQISIYDVVFANNVCNGAYANGIGCGLSVTGSVDYCAIIGNVVYAAAKGSACYSNINVLQPYNYDTQPGTHIYVGGNFSFGALNTPNCNRGFPATDGEGINIDTLDNGGTNPYSGQVLVDNNILVNNGGRGLEVELNYRCTNCAHVYLRNNTQWGNAIDANQTAVFCGDQEIYQAYNVESFTNLVSTNASTACTGNALYAYQMYGANSTDQVYNNWGYSAAENNALSTGATGAFAFAATNMLGTNPNFANAVAPGAPSCSGFANAWACMASMIANFTPTNAAAKAYGYHSPSATQVYDPLFPQWLCSLTNMPVGLVTMGCLTSPADRVILTLGKVQ